MKKQEITDEEIRGMMDFQQVLREHQQIVTTRAAKYWMVGIGAVVITSLIVYLMTSSTEPIKPIASSPPTPAKKEVPVKIDSVEKKSVIVSPPARKASISKVNEAVNKPGNQPTEEVKANVYLPAEPVNGYPNLYTYFHDQLNYPAAAAKDSVQGVVSVTFIVTPEGKVDHITIANSLGVLFDTEALRLIQNMPLWKPAQLNGKAVPSKMSVPLTFRIQPTKK
jgi:TonB family protein